MAKRAMMFCPRCRMVGLTNIELVSDNPEPDVFRCGNGHAFANYLELMQMNPDKIKLVPMEKPGPNDIKVEVFVNAEIWDRFKKAYPHQINSTVQSIMQLYLLGEPIIIDGVQAKRINAMGVRTGAEMVAALEVGKSLEDQLAAKTGELQLIQDMLSKAGVNVGA